jgi:hypothetical protein
MTTIQDERLEDALWQRFRELEAPYTERALSTLPYDFDAALAAMGELASKVIAELRTFPGVEDVTTNLAESGGGELTLTVTVRVGAQLWLPSMGVVVGPYRWRGQA